MTVSIKKKMNDLIEHLDGKFPGFYIVNHKFLHDAEDNQLEAVLKVCFCKETNRPYLQASILRTEEIVKGEPIDVENFGDPMEILNVNEVLNKVASIIL